MEESTTSAHIKIHSSSLKEERLINNNSVLTAVFDAINQHIFNYYFDGLKLEWCDALKSRAAVTYQQETFAKKQVYIRCSKPCIKDVSRKEFMEIILYELICLYMHATIGSSGEEIEEGLQKYLLKGAIQYLNTTYETNLKINNNYTNDNIGADVKEILNLLAIERGITNKMSVIHPGIIKCTPGMKILTKKLTKGKSDDYKCKPNCAHGCYCKPNVYRQCFLSSNIMAIYAVKDDTKCLLCETEVPRGTMKEHLDCDCPVFEPLGLKERPNYAF